MQAAQLLNFIKDPSISDNLPLINPLDIKDISIVQLINCISIIKQAHQIDKLKPNTELPKVDRVGNTKSSEYLTYLEENKTWVESVSEVAAFSG